MSRRLALGLALALVVVTAAVYAPLLGHGFVNYDDDLYVTRAPFVRQGLSLEGAAWSFSTFRGANWFPLTWLSWMLDVELYGLDPHGFHLSSLLLHCANALLLFAALARLTGAGVSSAVVAAVFALHPLHVESVAWIAARKDLVSGLFWMLALLAYERYARAGKPGWYLAVAGCLLLGLMAKPVVVALPFALLLLDAWPLGRLGARPGAFEPARVRAAVLEKLPLFALAAAFAGVALVAQRAGGALQSIESFPLDVRVANALVAYATYVGQAVWPSGLTVFYPHPGAALPLWKAIASGVFVLAVSLLALRALPRRPYVAVGWFWFLGILVPVIGLVQVGQAAMADRYTYIPLIGLALAAVWWVRDVVGARPRARLAAAALGVAVVAAFAVVSAFQVRTWRNSVTLFEHALRVTQDNHVAHINLAMAYVKSRRLEDAEHQLAEARRIAPGSLIAEGALGEVRLKQGRPAEALRHLELASQRAPRASRWHAGRAQALFDLDEFAAAAESYGAALRIDPHNAVLHGNLGLALFRAGRVDDAIASYEESLRLVPGRADVRGNLGIALAARGDEERAISQFERALAARPDLALLRAHLARALAGRGEYAGAVAQLAEAARLEPEQADLYVELARALTVESADASGRRDPAALDRLAATYAAAGRFDAAVRAASSAASLADERGDTALAAEIRARLAAYEERRSVR